MKKKRIALFVNSLYGGGAERVLQIVLRNLDREKYDITIVNHRQEEVNEFYPTDIAYRNILKSRSKLGKFWVKVYNKLNLLVYENFSPRLFRSLYFRESFDVEIAFIEGYATRIVSGGRSARKIAWVHIDLDKYPWSDIAFRSREEQKECYSRFDTVVSVSKSVRRSVQELFDRDSVVVYNPMDTEEIRRSSTEFEAGREKEPMLFVSVGRLVPQKGYDRLIPIVGRLVEEGFDLKLWIVGEGTERERLEEQIERLGLGNIVTLQGYKPNPYPYLKAADWFVLSSRYEGYGLVVAEALILGTPAISVMCAEMEQILGENNEWGITVENDDEALLSGIRDILTKRELTETYRAKAAERGDLFSLARQMDEICNIIDGAESL